MNDIAFNAMYERLVFLAPAATETVRNEGIGSLRLLGALDIGRVKYFFKAIRRPGGAAIGNAVSEIAEHHLIVAFHIEDSLRE